jgi:nucleoside-diphosphate-sugar epimerase
MHALISGATGFVGSHLAETLHKQGFKVSCLVRPTSDRKWIKDKPFYRLEVDFYSVDHLARAMKDVTHIFHCAGVISSHDDREYFRGNWGVTHNMMLAAQKHSGQIERFVYVSSLAAVGPAKNGAPVDENTPCAPVSEYGKTKLLGENEVLAAKDRLPVTVIRPPIVYGPRDSGLQVVYKIVNKGLVPRVGAKRLLSLVSVQDLCEGIARAAIDKGAAGQVYFVTDERIFSFDFLVQVIAYALKKKVKWVNIHPRLAGGIMGGLASLFSALGIKSMITKDKAAEAVNANWICTGKKFTNQFGMASKVKMEDGMIQTVKWYLEQKLI